MHIKKCAKICIHFVDVLRHMRTTKQDKLFYPIKEKNNFILIHRKGVQSGLDQDSVQASQVAPCQMLIDTFMDLAFVHWILLCKCLSIFNYAKRPSLTHI